MSDVWCRFEVARLDLAELDARTLASEGLEACRAASGTEWQALRDAKLGEIERLCWQVVDLSASSREELVMKAEMLDYVCIPGDGDLVHDLARSMALDIRQQRSE